MRPAHWGCFRTHRTNANFNMLYLQIETSRIMLSVEPVHSSSSRGTRVAAYSNIICILNLPYDRLMRRNSASVTCSRVYTVPDRGLSRGRNTCLSRTGDDRRHFCEKKRFDWWIRKSTDELNKVKQVYSEESETLGRQMIYLRFCWLCPVSMLRTQSMSAMGSRLTWKSTWCATVVAGCTVLDAGWE